MASNPVPPAFGVSAIDLTAANSKALEFDYIVVGGGTAGNAVATRLSQGLPSAKILIVEAGPAAPDDLGILVPGRKGTTLFGTYDWNFTTVAQTHLNSRALPVNRGKVVGGSSALNFMVWDRAAAAEFDQWEEVGNPGWNWASMHAAMTKSEKYLAGPPGSGTQGPVDVVLNRYIPTHQEAWVPAVTQGFNIPVNNDSLQGNVIGVSLQPSSINPKTYARSYSANAYLPEAGPNLFLLADTEVARINFSPSGTKQRAVGVTLANGTTITATKEIILAAGVVQTPTLLEHSGIGQPAVLKAANITPLIDLPGVGENYQDHLRLQLSYQLKDPHMSIDVLRYNTTVAAGEMEKWRAGNPSLFDHTFTGYLFANWDQVLGSENASSLTTLAQQSSGESHPSHAAKLAQLSNPSIPQGEIIYTDGYIGVKGYPAAGTPLSGKHFFTLILALMHPLSRGSVHINPADPHGKPLIDPQFLNNEYDVQALVGLAKFGRRIAETGPLRANWETEYEPGLEVQTDEQFREWVKNSSMSIFHPTSTAAMLPREKGGVVDPELRVYGTENLRVVDASVVPVQISAHIQTAVYGIAERAGEIIIAAAKAGEN